MKIWKGPPNICLLGTNLNLLCRLVQCLPPNGQIGALAESYPDIGNLISR